MNLHSNLELFKNAIYAASQFFNLREIYVEKDYWITVALHKIFTSEIADQVIFKGGTALSKCFGVVERFSEDIDVVVKRIEGENDNQMKKKIKKITELVSLVIPEIEVSGLTNKRGNIRKTVHNYMKLYDDDFGQVKKNLVLETTWLGNCEPNMKKPVKSYLYDMMINKGQNNIIKEYQIDPISVNVLSMERTFCEKIMSLVRFSRTDDPVSDLRNKIRHIYDINQMLSKSDEIKKFLETKQFDDMLIKVGKDDLINFKNKNEWIYRHPSEAIIFSETEKTWENISSEYNLRFKELVTGNFPEDVMLVQTLKNIFHRLQKVEWNL